MSLTQIIKKLVLLQDRAMTDEDYNDLEEVINALIKRGGKRIN